MLRLLLAVLVTVLLLTRESQAFNPEGATESLTDFGGGHGLSLGLFGIENAGHGTVEDLPLRLRIGIVGVGWACDGWSIGLAAGQVQYGIPAVIDVAAPLRPLDRPRAGGGRGRRSRDGIAREPPLRRRRRNRRLRRDAALVAEILDRGFRDRAQTAG